MDTQEHNGTQAPGVDPQTLADLDRAGGEFTEDDIPGGEDAPAVDPQLSGAITAALVITFGLLVRLRGDHWSLTGDEAGEAGTAYAAVIEKYFPGAGGGVEVTAILITAGIVVPRLAVDKVQQEKRAIEYRNREASSGGEQTE